MFQAATMMMQNRPAAAAAAYINGLPSHMASLPPHLTGAGMFNVPSSSAVRMEGLDVSAINSWSAGQPMKQPTTSAPQQQSATDPRMVNFG
jgi:hypothetical protein